MKENEFVYVLGDDWVALYVNGKLVDQGHSLSVRDIFDAIEKAGGVITRTAQVECDEDWLMIRGDYPPTLREVRLVGSFPHGLNLG
jgi:hypothetical protein